MDYGPLIRRWGNNFNLPTVRDSRGVRYVPVTKIEYIEVVDDDMDSQHLPSLAFPAPSLIHTQKLEPSLPDRDGIIPRPFIEPVRPMMFTQREDFEIPRPTFLTNRNSVRRDRFVFTRGSPESLSRHKSSRDRPIRHVTTRDIPALRPPPQRYPPLPAPKPKFRYKNLSVYPPKRENETGIMAAKRKLIREAIASSDYSSVRPRRSGSYGEWIIPHPIYLPEVRPQRPDTPRFRKYSGFEEEKTPPLPERHYAEPDLEPTTSSVDAFTPLEGQLATKKRSSVISQWQETLISKALLKGQLMRSIEENPDY